MQDKIVFITGGNDGIGKATALALAQKGAILILACRNLEKGEQAVQEIRQKTSKDQAHLIPLDLADYESIRKASQTFRDQFDHLDVLINNAGLFSTSLQKTKHGIELQFGVNHLGHFLLTNLLLDPLKAAPEARVVNVSSNAHYNGEIDFNNLRGEKNNYTGMRAYAQAKLANVLFTREFAQAISGYYLSCPTSRGGIYWNRK